MNANTTGDRTLNETYKLEQIERYIFLLVRQGSFQPMITQNLSSKHLVVVFAYMNLLIRSL